MSDRSHRRHKNKKKRSFIGDFFYQIDKKITGKSSHRKKKHHSSSDLFKDAVSSHSSNESSPLYNKVQTSSERTTQSKKYKKKRNFISQFFHDLNKKTIGKSSRRKRKSRSSSQIHDLLSPYTETGSSSFEDRKFYSSERKRKLRKKRRKKKNFISNFFYNLRKDIAIASENRKKAKYKKNRKKRHRKEYKKFQKKSLFGEFFSQFRSKKSSTDESPELSSESLKSKQPRKNYLYSINSFFLFIISYILVYMIYQFTVLISASFFGLDSILFYYDLAFNDFSPLWTRLNIIFITLSGPFISLVIGILFYNVFTKIKKITGLYKLFFLWISFHGFNFFLGAFVSGVSFDEGLGYVANWLYMNVFVKIFFSLIFLFILSVIGYYSTKKFLETSNSIYRIKREYRMNFLLNVAVIPWLAGSLFMLFVKIPNNPNYETGMLFTMFFLVIPVLFNMKAKAKLNLPKGKRKKTQINWVYLIVFLILISAYRIGLNTGLHFILSFKFSISITPV
ncbi:MAG: hypothetical protein K8R58_03755 [Bacteroidales bacterium]|nr:hypothetical protein [Bacteroidales bacterium]